MDDSDGDSDVEMDINEFMLTHAVLPRYLPEQKPQFSQQRALMTEMMKTITNLEEWMPSKTVQFFKRFKELHGNGTSISSSLIQQQIRSLSADDTFAMFVRRQNCTLIIHKLADGLNDVVVATFPGDLLSSEIYKHDSDIEVISIEFGEPNDGFAHQMS